MNINFRNGGASCVAVFACIANVAFLSSCSTSPTIDNAGQLHGRITRVVDGDTVMVNLGSHTETIRLIGVNTPETKHPTKPIECWGPEASAHTHELLPVGTDVVVVRDEEARDKYGRLLAYITRAHDNMFINLDLVSGGWAETLTIAPNTAHEEAFSTAEATAERLHLGLWGHCRR